MDSINTTEVKEIVRKGFRDLNSQIIKSGICTSCGVCVGICPIDCIQPDYEGKPKIVSPCNYCELCFELCPQLGLEYNLIKFLGNIFTSCEV